MVGTEGSTKLGEAADREYLDGFVHRTTMLLGEAALARLRGKTVAVAGCGGVGGASALTLARLGVGGVVLADPGLFDPPDANRQWAATRASMGRNKALVHADLLRGVNPAVRLRIHEEGVTEENLDAFLGDADLLLDCLDISVPLALRGRVYRAAMAKGLHAVSAPIFGFGTLVLLAEPGGMGMDQLIDGFVRVASTESRLPAGFPDFYFGPHLETIERHIHKHRVPSSSLSVTLATGLVSAEIARIFLREHDPEIPPPVALPRVTVVEPLRRTFRVVHHEELFRARLSREERERALAAARHDVVRLPDGAVAHDLLSDVASRAAPLDEPTAAGELEGALRELLGLEHVVAVGRGRLAEALLAPLVVRPGRAVAMVAPFPTTRFQVEAAGGRVLEVGDPGRPGEVDLARLTRELPEVGAIWLEPCANALGGQPMSLATLRAVRALADAAGVPLILDAARIWTNAALLRDREPDLAGRAVEAIARDLLALADACAMPLGKELPTPSGGAIALRSPELALAVRERAFLSGDGLDPTTRSRATAAARDALARGVGAPARVAAARALGEALRSVGAPVVIGGHGVWLDAARALPHLSPERLPARALANALYSEAGVRVAPNMGGPPDRHEVRCAVGVATDPRATDALVEAVRAVLARAGSVRGLERIGGPPGLLGSFVGDFRPAERP